MKIYVVLRGKNIFDSVWTTAEEAKEQAKTVPFGNVVPHILTKAQSKPKLPKPPSKVKETDDSFFLKVIDNYEGEKYKVSVRIDMSDPQHIILDSKIGSDTDLFMRLKEKFFSIEKAKNYLRTYLKNGMTVDDLEILGFELDMGD